VLFGPIAKDEFSFPKAGGGLYLKQPLITKLNTAIELRKESSESAAGV
jgi:hypothetical protein